MQRILIHISILIHLSLHLSIYPSIQTVDPHTIRIHSHLLIRVSVHAIVGPSKLKELDPASCPRTPMLTPTPVLPHLLINNQLSRDYTVSLLCFALFCFASLRQPHPSSTLEFPQTPLRDSPNTPFRNPLFATRFGIDAGFADQTVDCRLI